MFRRVAQRRRKQPNRSRPKLSLDESEPARIARPRVIFTPHYGARPRIAARGQKIKTPRLRRPLLAAFWVRESLCEMIAVLRNTFNQFFPPARPNRLRLPSAQTSTTAPVTMTTCPSPAWPSPSRPKSSCTSKRSVPACACARVPEELDCAHHGRVFFDWPCRNLTTTGG